MMQKTSRGVVLNIGKSVYTINTQLARQEDILMLACLRLAYSLNTVNEKLKIIVENLNSAG